MAISRGEAHELSSYKRAIRRDYVGEGFPSAGAGYMPPRAGERILGGLERFQAVSERHPRRHRKPPGRAGFGLI
jgi:hypothetical protein